MATTRSRCDPCGIICIIFIYLIVVYTDYAFIRWIVLPLNIELWPLSVFAIATYQAILILLIWCHAMAVVSDPGVVPHTRYGIDVDANQHLMRRCATDDCGDDHNWSVCAKCQMYRPPKAHHCRICNRCIRKMDHHCPWINNCVGELNHKYFLQFLIYTGITCIYTLLGIIMSFIKLKQNSQQRMVHTSLLLMESLLFGLFVIAVLTDQLHAVFNSDPEFIAGNNNLIVKKPKKMLAEVCGRGPVLWWLFPLRTNHYNSVSSGVFYDI